MAFEVDAALALNGNRWAGLALLGELRRLAVGVLQYDAIRRVQGADERLEALCREIYTPPELAEVAQRERYWADRPLARQANLLRYLVQPYRKLVFALDRDLNVHGLATAITDERPWERTTNGTLRIDDLASFLAQADQLYR
jgi:hypothetical protein